MTTVVTPIIHSNGNTAEALLDQLKHAYRAVNAAINALEQAAPNARNYYPAPGLFEQAIAQHKERAQALHAVKASLSAEVIAIAKSRTPRAGSSAPIGAQTWHTNLVIKTAESTPPSLFA